MVALNGRSGAVVWRRIFGGGVNEDPVGPHSVALDSRGNVLVAGPGSAGRRRGNGPRFTVIKLAAADGALRWRHDLRLSAPPMSVGGGGAVAVSMDATDDVVAAGGLGPDTDSGFIVAKLSGANGSERWRQVLSTGHAAAVVVDGVGDVIAAGWTRGDSLAKTLTVMKLAGSDGRELWRYDLAPEAPDASNSASAVRIDRDGNVIVAGQTRYLIASSEADFAVFKLSGATGTVLWRRTISASGHYAGAKDVAVDRRGAVLAVGEIPQTGSNRFSDFAVVKLDGSDGTELWRFTIDGSLHIFDRAQAVALDSADDVAAAGFIQNDTTGPDLVVTKLSGIDGAELARRVVAKNGSDVAFAVAVDRTDRAIAAGMTSNDRVSSHFSVVTMP